MSAKIPRRTYTTESSLIIKHPNDKKDTIENGMHPFPSILLPSSSNCFNELRWINIIHITIANSIIANNNITNLVCVFHLFS